MSVAPAFHRIVDSLTCLCDADHVKFGAVVLPLIALLLSCKSSRRSALPFEEVSQQTGLDFWQFSGATGDFLLPEITGSGAALIDYDNDGDLDVYLVQGAPLSPQPGAGSRWSLCRRAGSPATGCSGII